jgi:hypothetical protein
MKNKHSLISPSNFERRMLCAGSLFAEKDLPEQTSKYAEKGKLLHKRTELYNAYLGFTETQKFYYDTYAICKWSDGLFKDDKNAVIDAATYFQKLKNEKSHTVILGEFHEIKRNLSFIHPEMKGGTADSVLLMLDIKTQNVEVHVIDYKFGKGVAVDAYKNYQLLLYCIGVLHDEKIKKRIDGKQYSVHLHIVQPFIKNSRWDLTLIDVVGYINNKDFYKKVAEDAYDPNAKRTPDKKACEFCKAKPTCYALAKTVPKLDTDVFDLEDDEISKIYDNRDLIKMYLRSIEEHIRNKISTTGFDGYELAPKMSNRKWTQEASKELPKLLGDDKAFDIAKKLITITRAEKLLDKETMSKLTIREVSGDEIVKITTQLNIKNYSNYFND